MNKIFILRMLLVFSILTGLTFCSNNKKEQNKIPLNTKKEINYSQNLLNELIKKGDFINSKNTPALIDAKEVEHLLGSNILVIDLRNGKAFSEGHIKGAIQIKYKELIDYFQVSGTPDYEKVVIVCYTGQMASFSTSVLRMLGYNNVYAMNYGMCAWNKKFAKKRIKNAQDRKAVKLETTLNPKNSKGKLPQIKCKRKSGIEILHIRAKKLLKDGFKEGAVTIDDIISDPGDYYVVNYINKEVYELGHIKAAVNFTPNKSLKFDEDLLTLPTDKAIVIYGQDGQNSAFVVAYLRLLGYKAFTLKYGANSFMNSNMLKNEKLGKGFNEELINNFKFETSPYVEEEGGVEEGGC